MLRWCVFWNMYGSVGNERKDVVDMEVRGSRQGVIFSIEEEDFDIDATYDNQKRILKRSRLRINDWRECIFRENRSNK